MDGLRCIQVQFADVNASDSIDKPLQAGSRKNEKAGKRDILYWRMIAIFEASRDSKEMNLRGV